MKSSGNSQVLTTNIIFSISQGLHVLTIHIALGSYLVSTWRSFSCVLMFF